MYSVSDRNSSSCKAQSRAKAMEMQNVLAEQQKVVRIEEQRIRAE